MVDFVNKLDLSDQNCHTNLNLRDENNKGKLLFPMKYICVIRYISSVNVFYVNHIVKIQY